MHDIIANYVSEAEPASDEQQRRYVKQWQRDNDEEALRHLVESTIQYVVRMVKNHGHSNHYDDLINGAVEGVIEAADRFDPDNENTFLRYAHFWILSKITSFYRSKAPLKISDRTGRKVLEKRNEALQKVDNPTPSNIAEYLGVDTDDLHRAQNARYPVRLDETNDLGRTYRSKLRAGRNQHDVLTRRESHRMSAELARKFGETLDKPRDRAVYFERILALEPKSLTELGEEFGVTKQRMQQIDKRIREEFRGFVEQQSVDFHVPTSSLSEKRLEKSL